MNREEMKQRIISLIDDSRESARKICFYSDPSVSSILDSLYKRWEDGNRVGIPLDYANDEELEILYRMAVKYQHATEADALSVILASQEQDRVIVEKKGRSLLRKIFWFLFPG